MDNSRYEKTVTIGGRELPISYTTAAVIKIAKLTEGRDVKTLPKSVQIELVLESARIMINCAVAARNMQNGTNEQGLREGEIALLASREELAALMEAMKQLRSGANRDIKTEEPPKKENAE